MADTYLYSPYGMVLASTGSDVNPFRYGGQAGYYADANNLTQTVLCGLRWYSPSLGRWLSRDPIGYAGGANLYEYCGSNPVMELDPFGMDGNAGQFLLGQAKAFWNHNFDDNMLVSFIHGMGGNTDWGHIAPTNDDQIDGHSVGTVLYIGATFFMPGGEAEAETFVTYVIENDGKVVYVGKTSGIGTPAEVLTERLARKRHKHYFPKSGDKARVIATQGNEAACAGAEQVWVDYYRHVKGMKLRNIHDPLNFKRADRILKNRPKIQAYADDLRKP